MIIVLLICCLFFNEYKVVAMSRIVFVSSVAESAFKVRNAIGAIVRQIEFLRYVDLFGPAEENTSLCPPPLTQTQIDKMTKLLLDPISDCVKVSDLFFFCSLFYILLNRD
jgi:hypothetical protein